jgi:hypothetical protein
MGTRCLTIIRGYPVEGKEPAEIAVLYRQSDGYPTGHGAELKEFLKGFTIRNGIRVLEPKGKVANGPNCLAAMIVAHFKDDIGSFYLHPAGTRDRWEDYRYYVTAKFDEPLHLRVTDDEDKPLYDGPLDDFDPEAQEAA